MPFYVCSTFNDSYVLYCHYSYVGCYSSYGVDNRQPLNTRQSNDSLKLKITLNNPGKSLSPSKDEINIFQVLN